MYLGFSHEYWARRLFCSLIVFLLAGNVMVEAEQSDANVVVELLSADAVTVSNVETMAFSLNVTSEMPLAGAQFRIGFGAEGRASMEPVLTARSADMTLVSAITNGELIVLVYSAEGHQISPGCGPVVNLLCSFNSDDIHPIPPTLKQVILADIEARSIPVMVRTTVASGPLQTPACFSLFQNYPNPFNPSTDIRYQIPDGRSSLHTTLKVYNLLGQEVRALVDEPKAAGYYTVTWDGRDHSGQQVASGFYFCRLNAGEFSQTVKVVLLK